MVNNIIIIIMKYVQIIFNMTYYVCEFLKITMSVVVNFRCVYFVQVPNLYNRLNVLFLIFRIYKFLILFMINKLLYNYMIYNFVIYFLTFIIHNNYLFYYIILFILFYYINYIQLHL